MYKPLQVIQLGVDVVLFNIMYNKLHILLTKRATSPYRDMYSLPGGFVMMSDSVEQTVQKVLYRETGLFCDHLSHFGIFSEVHRDPRTRVVSLGYYSILSDITLSPKKGNNQLETTFSPFQQLPKLAFDHNDIVQAAYQKLQKDIQKTDIIKYFLPPLFTLNQLQNYCEIIYSRRFEKRNFRKFAQAQFKIQQTSHKEKCVAHRPAYLYKFL